MLLVTIDINGTDHYISNEFLSLTHFWSAKIATMAPIRYATAKEYGGYVEPRYGSISLVPNLFQGADWEPPKSCPIKIEYTETTEGDAITLFTGTAHRKAVQRDQIDYDLYGPADSETAVVSFTGFLQAEFSSECTTLGLTLDATRTTRAATLDVEYSPSGDRDRIAALSDLASFYSHYFWIEGTTLYLADMLLDNGSTLALTEFDVLPSTYDDPPPYSLFESEDSTVDGSHVYGAEFSVSPGCHITPANIVLALEDIKEISEKSQIVIKCPLVKDNIPSIGQKITLIDDSLQESTDIEMWARAIIYDFDNYEMVIEGEGTLS